MIFQLFFLRSIPCLIDMYIMVLLNYTLELFIHLLIQKVFTATISFASNLYEKIFLGTRYVIITLFQEIIFIYGTYYLMQLHTCMLDDVSIFLKFLSECFIILRTCSRNVFLVLIVFKKIMNYGHVLITSYKEGLTITYWEYAFIM